MKIGVRNAASVKATAEPGSRRERKIIAQDGAQRNPGIAHDLHPSPGGTSEPRFISKLSGWNTVPWQTAVAFVQRNRTVCNFAPNLLFLALICLFALPARAATWYVIVSGLGGEPDYDQRFTAAAKDLDRVFKSAGETAHVTTLSGAQATAAKFRETLGDVARDARPEDDFVLILIGHGSFDGVEYKFNFVGPDLTAAQIAELCDHIPARRQLVVNTTSASGGSVPALERPGRAVIAATKSGTEKNATVFARYWVEALQDPAADTDKSDSISAMEAFSYAAKKTAAFYDSQKRLATEHPVFDDAGRGDPVRESGNGQGQLMSSLTVLRLGGNLQASNDPAKRALLQKKEELEQKIDTLKYQKAAMDPVDYKKQLTAALLDLAKVQQELDK